MLDAEDASRKVKAKQTARFQSLTPFGWNSNFHHRAGQKHDDGLLSSQKNPQAFLFYRRMKTTDYGYAVIAELSGRVVGSEDIVTGTADRAKQCRFGMGQRRQVAQRCQCSWSGIAQPLPQTDGITGISRSQYRWIHPRVAKPEWIPLPEQEDLRQLERQANEASPGFES